MDEQINFNVPYLTGRESAYIADALRERHLSGDGPFTSRASKALAQLVGGGDALLTTSCTHALEMSALLLDLRPGDEVIVPSFTFVTSVSAFALRGAVPVFCDVRPDTLNIDERQVEQLITSRTRAVVVVHYAGVACEMDEILAIAERHGLQVIEDNAHGLGAAYKGRPLGSMGTMATQSFHETKNIQCGEGGALVINDPALVSRAEIIREKGTNRSQFFRGQIDKYNWVDLGSSFLPSDLLAAFLLAQLEDFADIQARRMSVWSRYDAELADWAEFAGVRRPVVPQDRTQPAHMYYMLMHNLEHQQAFLRHLRARGVMAVFHYQPLDSSPAGTRLGRAPLGCPRTAEIAERLVRLPLHAGMSDTQVDRVVDAVTSFAAV